MKIDSLGIILTSYRNTFNKDFSIKLESDNNTYKIHSNIDEKEAIIVLSGIVEGLINSLELNKIYKKEFLKTLDILSEVINNSIENLKNN